MSASARTPSSPRLGPGREVAGPDALPPTALAERATRARIDGFSRRLPLSQHRVPGTELPFPRKHHNTYPNLRHIHLYVGTSARRHLDPVVTFLVWDPLILSGHMFDGRAGFDRRGTGNVDVRLRGTARATHAESKGPGCAAHGSYVPLLRWRRQWGGCQRMLLLHREERQRGVGRRRRRLCWLVTRTSKRSQTVTLGARKRGRTPRRHRGRRRL